MKKTTTTIPIPGTDLLYNLCDSDRYVYHYTSAATFLDKILPSNTLRLSPYTETNDPKESKEWYFNSNIRDSSKYDFDDWPTDHLRDKMNEGLKRRTNVVCFSCDGKLFGDHIRDIHNRGWCKPRMWAHYADNHKGVCLVFERSKLECAFNSAFAQTRPLAMGRVSYRNRSVIPDLHDPTYYVIIDELDRLGWDLYIHNHLKFFHKRLFFEKNADWATENEYRCVVWGGNGSAVFVDVGDSLRGIMFGANVTPETIQVIYNAVHAKELFTQQLVWRGCAPWYNLEESFVWEIRYREEARRNGILK